MHFMKDVLSAEDVSSIGMIQLSESNFTSENFDTFLEKLKNCSEIDYISINTNKINNVEVNFFRLLDVLKNIKITHFNIRSSEYSDDNLNKFSSFLTSRTQPLGSLNFLTGDHDMWLHRNTSLNLTLLEDAIKQSQIFSLGFSFIDLDNIASESLKRIVSVLPLKELDISGTISNISEILNAVQDSIKSLSLSGNYLGSEELESLGNLIARTNLLRLDLSHTGLSSFSLERLAKNFANEHAPLDINISENYLKTMEADNFGLKLFGARAFDGAAVIANIIKNNPEITCMFARGCHLDDAGAKKIAAALPGSGVTWLGLPRNNITNSGVKAIAHAINQTKINNLNLSNCPISNDGIIALLEKLKTNVKLKILITDGCKFEFTNPEVYDKVINTLMVNNTLEIFSIECGEDNLTQDQLARFQELENTNYKISLDCRGRYDGELLQKIHEFSHRNMLARIESADMAEFEEIKAAMQ